MADHDNSYKLLFSHSEMVADLLRGFIREDWVRKLDFTSLEKVGAEYVSDDMRGRESDVVIPQATDLQEVKSMLAERVKEWTREWEQEGFQKGIQQGERKGFSEALEQARAILRQDLEERFGPLNEEAQRRLEAIGSLPDLLRLYSRLGSAPNLAALGLAEEKD